MKLLVVGVSHRTAPVALLERLAVACGDVPATLAALLARRYVGEATVLVTCNRVEVFAAVSAFHGGLTDIAAVLSERAEVTPAELAAHLYVHYEIEAVRHGYRVAAGLDSMVVGEAQILGQLRDAYAAATAQDAAGRLLHELMQQALRVGKRVRTETGIDRAGRSVVTAALTAAAEHFADDNGLAGRSVLVVGAGAMGALALATLRRYRVGPLWIANRTAERAHRLANTYAASVIRYPDIGDFLSTVDLVVCATAAPETVLGRSTVARALAASERGPAAGPLVIVDLAVPRDVDPDVAGLPGVELIDLQRLSTLMLDGVGAEEIAAAERIVTEEVDAFLSWLRGADVAPTVAALRARADEVVAAELRRLAQRRPDLTDEQRAEISRTVHRVVQRLLHSPTVRVRELAAQPGGDQAAALLCQLFDLEVPYPRRAAEVPPIEGAAP